MTLTEPTLRPILEHAFPADFLWGAATAAYQIEGAVDEGGRGPSIWDTFAHTPGKTVHGDTGDIACDHYHRWREDVDLMRHLGLNSYRMSVSWSRLQPSGSGPLNPTAVAYYRDLFPAFTRPASGRSSRCTTGTCRNRSKTQAGGQRATPQDGSLITQEPFYAASVTWPMTGSPSTSHGARPSSATATARTRRGAPDMSDAVAAAHHLNLGHGLAVQAARAEQAQIAIGGSTLITDIVAASSRDEDLIAARNVDANNNQMFLDPVLRGGYPELVHALYDKHGLAGAIPDGDLATIASEINFVGVNHYQQVVVHADPTDTHLGARLVPAEPSSTSLGWSVKPESLYNVLTRLSRDSQPCRSTSPRAAPVRGLRRPPGRRSRRRTGGVPARLPNRCRTCDQRGGEPPGVLRMVAPRQLRMGRGLPQTLRTRLRRLCNTDPHSQGQRGLVSRHNHAPCPSGRTGPLGRRSRKQRQLKSTT